ncbi:hypothetical protein [Dokdonia sp. Hel_I_53]|uniref:hypothetical protein n=1 Tax=Dokdonia sp. Hel_I_53 TaxID=1566287 RepID=UPI00119C6FC7|nr:hypothetical protein [Dokdonia sp. Hel_I_53]TVZ52178.1 hypothetical protein OD90_1348 [Dokdonia sp. Hel_I_53]
MRHTLAFLLLIFSIISCQNIKDSSTDLTQYIPRKAAVVIKVNDLAALQSDIANNDFIQTFSETPAYKFIAAQNKFLVQLKPQGETLLCFTKLGATDYEVSLITKLHKDLIKNDSTQITKGAIKQLDSTASYAYIAKGNVFIASTSTLLLENIERATTEKIAEDLIFKKAYQSASNSAIATVLLKGEEGATLFADFFPAADQNYLQDTFSWVAMDLNLDYNDIKTAGVVLTQEGREARLNLLRNTTPKKNRITHIAPTSLQSLTAITYKDWEVFKNNKAAYLRVDPSVFKVAQEDLFSSFDEVGTISLGATSVIIAISNDPSKTEEALVGNDFKTTFRDIEIYNFSQQDDFKKTYGPLLNLPDVTMYALVDDIYVFANDQTTLESIIANYQNNATLHKNTLFQNSAKQLSDASSYLYIESLDSETYKLRSGKNSQKLMRNISLTNYHYVAQQLVQESDYMLLNGLITKNEDLVNAGGIAQIANVKLNADLVMSPQLVKNHRTNGMDIVTQDVNNTLYLISNAGKVLWQKNLDGPVLGDMQQVDLYRNGRLQLAFTTPKSLYILDRNGKEVGAFPLSFSTTITQPLAVFDYDNNRKYRFVVVQNDQLLMYDKNGDAVTGFTFNKAPSPVLFPPTHVRTANKDYIVVAENNGKLNILSRTGKSRIDVKRKIDFGNTPIYKSGSNFETYNVNGEKISITTSGKLTQSISEHSSDSKITISPQFKVAQRENTLYINGKKMEIPFGSYAKPTVAIVKNKKYISLTNKESSEVFIYDGKGRLLPNFPVYGISPASIGHLERNKTLGFVTQGSPSSVLVYKIN